MSSRQLLTCVRGLGLSLPQLCFRSMLSLSTLGNRLVMLNRTESLVEVGSKDCYSYAIEWNICYRINLAGQLFILQLRRLMPSQKPRFNPRSQQKYDLKRSTIVTVRPKHLLKF